METKHISDLAGRFALLVISVGWLLGMLCSCANELNSNTGALGHVAFRVSVIPDTVNTAGRNISLSMVSADDVYSNTWSDYREMSVLDGFYTGNYRAKAVLGQEGQEGYHCECYVGTADFEIIDNELTTVDIVCSLSQARIRAVADISFSERFPQAYVVSHTSGASYVDVIFNDEDAALVTPGSTSVFVCLADAKGSGMMLDTGLTFATSADDEYIVEFGLAGDILSVSAGKDEVEITLDPSILQSPSPRIDCSGFTSGSEVYLTEGLPAESSIIMSVESPVALRKVMLTSSLSAEVSNGLPSECDLLEDCHELVERGISVVRDGDNRLSVDFTRLFENLIVSTRSDICFMVQAVDILGRASEVATLRVMIKGVEMTVISASKALVGIDTASVTLSFNVPEVEGSDFELFLDDRTTPDVEPLEIISTYMSGGNGQMSIDFRVPQGVASIPVRIDYMGKPRLSVDIQRDIPEFNFSVDAFATTVLANVRAATQAETSAIAKYARIMARGKEMAVLERDIENGYLLCSGFQPSTSYDVECVVLKDVSPKTCKVRTEKSIPVPDGDFEDIVDLIRYKNFPSGGRYSSTSFPIFNQQNFVDLDVKWPRKNWSSINAKTFCSEADMHNTWYMQPSSMIDFDCSVSGSKSIRMSSVGWSLHGGEIPPYVQPVDAFDRYNANFPPLDNISAGYLFLGGYSFNPSDRTEVVAEGVKFGSRPSSINGYFKYSPDEGNPSDRGWVRVELVNENALGEATVIGTAYMEFPYAPDFRSFNIPITYNAYFIPATRLKIMFCSSVYSDALTFDDPDVPVTADIPNSRYIGSTLWIDNLTFSY